MAVVATHARSGLKRLFLGSVTERLIRTISCPLLIVVPPDADTGSDLIEGLNFKNILVGCDFSPDSDRAVEYGLNLAQEFQAGLHLAHVIEPVDYQDIASSNSPGEELRQNLHDRSNRKLLNLVSEDTHNWCKVKTACLTGEPFEEISKYAVLHEIDLIVMG
ncbi:MAG: universal stress protein, partial [Deltaproteobacteria bacterium]|nr:universal stress protein [Deltaproteobacteria bacterium]